MCWTDAIPRCEYSFICRWSVQISVLSPLSYARQHNLGLASNFKSVSSHPVTTRVLCLGLHFSGPTPCRYANNLVPRPIVVHSGTAEDWPPKEHRLFGAFCEFLRVRKLGEMSPSPMASTVMHRIPDGPHLAVRARRSDLADFLDERNVVLADRVQVAEPSQILLNTAPTRIPLPDPPVEHTCRFTLGVVAALRSQEEAHRRSVEIQKSAGYIEHVAENTIDPSRQVLLPTMAFEDLSAESSQERGRHGKTTNERI